jgi:dTDP-4-dehydrorhamnose reductase
LQEQFYFPEILIMALPRILVTGAGGQLGSEFRSIASKHPQYEFLFVTRTELSVADKASVDEYFHQLKPDYCINCAAYTAVDKAESDKEQAFDVNANAVGYLARASVQTGTRFIHMSTDYVFDGSSATPYVESSRANPIGIYGLSKLKGEALCLLHNPVAMIIRTAWVYSTYGSNFVKTMIRMMNERKEINVVNDQTGSPTYAADLADAIMQIIHTGKWQPGIYHYANAGSTTWFGFATAIKELLQSRCEIKPVTTAEYPTKARRPKFSLLDTNKIRHTFGLNIPPWHKSLERCIFNMQKHNN